MSHLHGLTLHGTFGQHTACFAVQALEAERPSVPRPLRDLSSRSSSSSGLIIGLGAAGAAAALLICCVLPLACLARRRTQFDRRIKRRPDVGKQGTVGREIRLDEIDQDQRRRRRVRPILMKRS